MSINLIPLSNFYPEVKSLASGVLDPFVKDAVLRTVQRFCREAFIWEDELDAMDVLANVSDYDFVTAPGAYVISMNLFYSGRRLPPMTAAELAGIESGSGIRSGRPGAYRRLGSSTIRLDTVPTVTEQNAIKIVAFMMPTEDSEEISEEFWHEWREGVVAGAVAHLKAQMGKPWHDPDSYSYYQQKLEAMIERARIRALRKYTDGDMRASGRRII